MAVRETYSDIFAGREDIDIAEFLGTCNSNENHRTICRNLITIIENELTSRQHEFIIEYFFNKLKMAEIAEKYGVSVEAVSATIAAGKRRIYKFMKYCIRCDMC